MTEDQKLKHDAEVIATAISNAVKDQMEKDADALASLTADEFRQYIVDLMTGIQEGMNEEAGDDEQMKEIIHDAILGVAEEIAGGIDDLVKSGELKEQVREGVEEGTEDLAERIGAEVGNAVEDSMKKSTKDLSKMKESASPKWLPKVKQDLVKIRDSVKTIPVLGKLLKSIENILIKIADINEESVKEQNEQKSDQLEQGIEGQREAEKEERECEKEKEKEKTKKDDKKSGNTALEWMKRSPIGLYFTGLFKGFSAIIGLFKGGKIGDLITKGLMSVFGRFFKAGGMLVGAIAAAIGGWKLGKWLYEKFAEPIQDAIESTVTFFTDSFNKYVKEPIELAFAAMKDAWIENVYNPIETAFTNFSNMINDNLINPFISFFNMIADSPIGKVMGISKLETKSTNKSPNTKETNNTRKSLDEIRIHEAIRDGKPLSEQDQKLAAQMAKDGTLSPNEQVRLMSSKTTSSDKSSEVSKATENNTSKETSTVTAKTSSETNNVTTNNTSQSSNSEVVVSPSSVSKLATKDKILEKVSETNTSLTESRESSKLGSIINNAPKTTTIINNNTTSVGGNTPTINMENSFRRFMDNRLRYA